MILKWAGAFRIAVVTGIVFAFASQARADLLCQSVFGLPVSPPEYPTVEITGVTQNAEGQALLRLRRIGNESSWMSSYAKMTAAPQGNPLAPLRILGQDLAFTLGFELGPNEELLVPMPDTFNARLKVFNAFLQTRGIAPILISFFTQPSATMKSFINSWSQDKKLPFAIADETHTIHDISFHYPNILLPNEVVLMMQTMAEISQAWVEFNGIKYSQSRSVLSSVRAIDGLSTSANASAEGLSKKQIADRFSNFLHLGIPSYIAMSPFVPAGYAVVLNEYFEKTSPLDIFETILTLYDERAKVQTVDAFLKQTKQNHPEWAHTFSQIGLTDIDTIYSLYERRGQELREAATDFMRVKNGR